MLLLLFRVPVGCRRAFPRGDKDRQAVEGISVFGHDCFWAKR